MPTRIRIPGGRGAAARSGTGGVAGPMALGLIAAACFATTFVLNRWMSVAGGSWMWSASLRYLFMVVPLVALVAARGGLPGVLRTLRARPTTWLIWSTVASASSTRRSPGPARQGRAGSSPRPGSW